MTMPVGITCCTPILRYAPSGMAWYHATDCAREANEKIYRPPARETRHLRLVQRGEDSRASVPTTTHPAGTGRGHAATSWLTHPHDCICFECRYVDAHLDDGR